MKHYLCTDTSTISELSVDTTDNNFQRPIDFEFSQNMYTNLVLLDLISYQFSVNDYFFDSILHFDK